MWEAVTAVIDGPPDRVIYEGRQPALVMILNSGPAAVRLNAWSDFTPERRVGAPRAATPDRSEYHNLPPPDISMFMAPGDTRAVCGTMITADVAEPPVYPGPLVAALAWRIQP